MSNADKILKHLKDNCNERYCDDCLSNILSIIPRQSVNQICRLKIYDSIKREVNTCNNCLKNKLTNKKR